MEKRNIQKTGGTSYTVTLPKQWIEQSGLTDKSAVFMYMDVSGDLIIKPKNGKNFFVQYKLIIDNYTPEWITRELISLYLAGAEEILITSKRITPDQRTRIRETTQSLFGFEIIDESAESVSIKNIFDISKFSVAQSIEKMFLITSAMFSDTMTAVSNDDELLAKDIINRDVEIDKLFFVITRQFHALLTGRIIISDAGINTLDSNYYAYIAAQIERIADHTVKIAQQISEKKGKKLNGDFMLHKKTADRIQLVLKQSQQMVQSLDKKSAHRILDEYLSTEGSLEGFQQPFSLLTDSLDRMYRYILNIAEITIDYSVIKQK